MNYWGVILKMDEVYAAKIIKSEVEVSTFLDRLKYAIQSGSATINFQRDRIVDGKRNKRYTNRHTMLVLFSNEDEVEVLKRELLGITVCDYIETVKDSRFPKRSDLQVFGKKYLGEDVYIKFRVELVCASGSGNYVFVMSFHFAAEAFAEKDFPYRKKR